MLRIFIPFIVCVLSLSTIVKAQEMSLKDCVLFAVENNISFTNKKIEAAISKEIFQQSKRNLTPSLGLESTGNLFFGKSIDPTTNAFVNQKLFSTNFYLSSQIELFRGFVKQNTIKFNKAQYLMNQEDVRQKEMELSFEVMNNYYDVLYYQNLLEIVEEQVKLTQLNLKKMEKLIEIGLKAQADLLEMQAQEASELHNKLTISNKLESAELSLKKAMNYPVNELLILEKEAQFFVQNTPQISIIYEMALAHMPLVKRSQLAYEASKKNLAIKRGQFYPSLVLGGNYSTNFADSRKERIFPNEKDSPFRTIRFKDQFSQNASQSIYLQLSIPLFRQWRNRSQVKIAKYEQQIAENEQEDVEIALYQQITTDYQQLQALQKEYQQLNIKEKALEEAYKVVEKKLEKGVISIIEFYTAKNQLANAQAEKLRTQMQLRIKEKTMEYYMGK